MGDRNPRRRIGVESPARFARRSRLRDGRLSLTLIMESRLTGMTLMGLFAPAIKRGALGRHLLVRPPAAKHLVSGSLASRLFG